MKATGQSRSQIAGVTLIELLIVIAIAAILATIAVPSFREFVAGQRIKTASFDLMSMLTLARSEAIKRNGSVTLSGIGTSNVMIVAGGVTIQQRESAAGLSINCKSGSTVVACTDVIYSGNGRLQAVSPSIEISSTASSRVRCISIDLSGRPSSKKVACS